MKLRALLVTVAVALAAAPSAQAAGWKQLTANGGSNIDQVALLRTADGVLHVAWHHPTGPLTVDLLHTAIAANGTIGATAPIAAGWAVIQNAALVAAPGGGLRAFWGGIRTTDAGETNQDLNTALSGDGGASWGLQIGSVVPPGGQPYGSPASAAALPDGTPLVTWAGTLGTWVHSGLTPATANFEYQAPQGNYGYDPGIATDAGGNATLAWYSNATGHLGVFAQGVSAGGAPIGSAVNMPGTSDLSIGQLARTPIVSRSGSGGFYVLYPASYPELNRVRLWRVGTSTSTVLASTERETATALAADAAGRLWAVWKDGTRILARRSNPNATAFGATVVVAGPKSASSLYRIDANAAPGGGLDLFGSFTIGAVSSVSTYHTRILPGLTLAAKPKSLPAQATKVAFTVTDAGVAVKGAKVKASGKSQTTDSKGRVTLSLKGKATATATAAGYVKATLKLK